MPGTYLQTLFEEHRAFFCIISSFACLVGRLLASCCSLFQLLDLCLPNKKGVSFSRPLAGCQTPKRIGPSRPDPMSGTPWPFRCSSSSLALLRHCLMTLHGTA